MAAVRFGYRRHDGLSSMRIPPDGDEVLLSRFPMLQKSVHPLDVVPSGGHAILAHRRLVEAKLPR